MFKKAIVYLLSTLVVIFALISILSIWDVIEIERVFNKSLKTLFVLFIASAIILFIMQVLNRDEKSDEELHS